MLCLHVVSDGGVMVEGESYLGGLSLSRVMLCYSAMWCCGDALHLGDMLWRCSMICSALGGDMLCCGGDMLCDALMILCTCGGGSW